METGYYYVGEDYGWNQEKFSDPLMKGGGCAAVTACDLCIFLSRFKGEKKPYPFDAQNITDEDYKKFSRIMKPYLHPRLHGINRLETYIEGLREYFRDIGFEKISMEPLSGRKNSEDAGKAIISSIDSGLPVASLTLKHKNPIFDDFIWHWYMITGYEIRDGSTWVKAVSYGEWKWLELESLWNTGYEQRGGLVLFHLIKK